MTPIEAASDYYYNPECKDTHENVHHSVIENAFLAGYQHGKEWTSAKDFPLFTEDKTGCWTLTEAGCKEFLAAVPYIDNKRPSEKNLWWIRLCVIGDGGLEIVGDDDNESAGWSLNDVTHYLLIEPPKI
jgi:hypothetical protein